KPKGDSSAATFRANPAYLREYTTSNCSTSNRSHIDGLPMGSVEPKKLLSPSRLSSLKSPSLGDEGQCQESNQLHDEKRNLDGERLAIFTSEQTARKVDCVSDSTNICLVQVDHRCKIEQYCAS